ncbi:MAG: ABC transporter permease, partial [Pirellulales bacterium]
MTSVSPHSTTPAEPRAEPGAEPTTQAAAVKAWSNDNRHYSALWQIVLTRIREFYRRPTAIFWVYVFPILMAVVLGVAFSNPTADEVRAGIVSDGHPELADRIADALARQQAEAATGSTKISWQLVSDLEGRRGLRLGRYTLLVVPRNASTSPGASPPATKQSSDVTALAGELAGVNLEYLYDPGAPQSYAGRWAVDDALQRAAGRREPLATTDARFEEPGSRYIDFVIPGLIGASLMSSGLWGVGFVVVDMRVRNLLKRFFTTPMSRADFLSG